MYVTMSLVFEGPASSQGQARAGHRPTGRRTSCQVAPSACRQVSSDLAEDGHLPRNIPGTGLKCIKRHLQARVIQQPKQSEISQVGRHILEHHPELSSGQLLDRWHGFDEQACKLHSSSGLPPAILSIQHMCLMCPGTALGSASAINHVKRS